MPAARAEARLPAMIGQDAFDRAASALVALVEARRRIVETHASLDEARQQIGLREVNSGDSVPKVPGVLHGGIGDGRPGCAVEGRGLELRLLDRAMKSWSGQGVNYYFVSLLVAS